MLWIKAFHIVAIVSWFSGLFYLPRLFIYHVMSDDQISKDRFKIMERKLFRAIATPAMIATILLGAWLSHLNWAYYSTAGWYWCKMILVAGLIGYHYACWIYLKQLHDDRCRKSHTFFRWFNEVPVLFLVGIVVLAIVKPF